MSWLVFSFTVQELSHRDAEAHRERRTISHGLTRIRADRNPFFPIRENLCLSVADFSTSVSLCLRGLLFQSHRHPRIVCVHLRVATQQLFRLFRNHFRQNHLYLNKLIAVSVRVAQRRRAPPPQAKLLS